MCPKPPSFFHCSNSSFVPNSACGGLGSGVRERKEEHRSETEVVRGGVHGEVNFGCQWLRETSEVGDDAGIEEGAVQRSGCPNQTVAELIGLPWASRRCGQRWCGSEKTGEACEVRLCLMAASQW